MAKDPAILFYPDNFLSGTMFMTDEQVGKYMRALCAQQLHGHLTLDQLNVFCKDDKTVLSKFKTDENGLFFNERMDYEIQKRSDYCDSRRSNRNKSKDMKQHMSEHTSQRMGNGNGNGNINNEFEFKTEKQKDKTKDLWREPTEEGFKAYLKMAEPHFDALLKDWNWIAIQKEYYPGCCVKRTIFKMWEQFWGTKAGWKNKRDAAKRNPEYDPDWKLTIERTFKRAICYYGRNEQDDEATHIAMLKRTKEDATESVI